MTSTMIQAAHTGAATAAEYIVEMHKQYRIGRNTIGSEKKSRKMLTTTMADTRHLLLRWAISSSDAMVIDGSDIGEITVVTRKKATAVMSAAVVVAVVVEME